MGTQPSDPSSLAEPLRSALAKEVDPNESLRWCGQPAPDAAFRRACVPAILGTAGLLVIGVFAILLSVSIWQELNGIKPLLEPGDSRPSYTAVVLFGLFGGIVLLSALVVAHSPWRARDTARRTVYTVTNTRVLELVLSSTRPDASTRIQAVEPGHPLHIRRTTNPDGRGDIFLYPSGSNSAKLTLIGVADSREVERIIRTTFDPSRA